MIWAQPLHYWQGGGKLFTLRCEPFKSGGWCIPLWALNHASISLSRSREEQESGQGQEAVCVRRDQICSCDVWSHEPAAAAVPSESWGRSAEKHNSFITLSIHHLVSYGPDFFFHPPLLFMIGLDQKSPYFFVCIHNRTLNGLKHLYHFKVDWRHENSSQDVNKLGFQTVHQPLDSLMFCSVQDRLFIVCHVLSLIWECYLREMWQRKLHLLQLATCQPFKQLIKY